jgi:hypothetical protein
VFFDPEDAPRTKTHTEHAALSKAVLEMLINATSFDFKVGLDVCGSVLWFYSVDAENGFTPIKDSVQLLKSGDLPLNWEANIAVMEGKRARVQVLGYDAEESDKVDDFSANQPKVNLDPVHKKILDMLDDSGYSSMWVHDHGLCQTHTGGLKVVFDKLKDEGRPLKGWFDTDSSAEDPGEPNCLAGNTKVITREGLKPIKELAGKDVEIITTRGAWVTAPFKSYGEQDVFAVTLKRGNKTRVIKATGDHRWFVCKRAHAKSKINMGDRKEVTTCDLEEGQILVQTKPQLNIIPSVVGIQHGLVWGDGTNGGIRKTSSLSLFGEKDAELLRFFVEHPKRQLTNSVGGTEVWNLPYHFKSLVPLHYDKPYLYGWLAGYFAADGCVGEMCSHTINSTDKKSLEHVRDVCHILGIETSQVAETWCPGGYKPGYAYRVSLKASDLKEEFFLIAEHKRRFNLTKNRQYKPWRVASVEPASREEVFCCTVEGKGCFCLEDFVLVGNCFMRPAPDGAFDVYRFGKGTPENALWRKSESWTYIKYNAPVNFVSVCENLGGKRSKPGGFKFTSLDKAREAARMLGAELTLPDISPTDIEKRGIVLGRRGKDAIGVFIRKVQGDREMFFDGWECEKGYWGLEQDSEPTHVEVLTDQDVHALDSEVRAVVIGGLEGINSSWHLLTTSEQWVNYRSSEINCVVNAWASDRSSNPRELADRFKAWAVKNPWKDVSWPFQAEYPGGRVWNRGAPQFVYQPVDKAVESIKTPHWDIILEHCGRYLTPSLRQQTWTSEYNIATGGDYLRAWIACLFRHPFDKLPYLFMYGPSGGGKSIFAEAVDLLVTCGVDGADNALTNPQGFNGELAHSILGVVDETNLSSNSTTAYNRIKDWSTALTINIHKKGLQIYSQPNSLHFCQFSNTLRALDIPPGDTRITPVYVAKPDTEIPKGILLDSLMAEASHFMRYLVDLNLPAPRTRLRLPFVSIPESERRVYEDPLNFIECVYAHIDGAKEKLEDVYCHFFTCLPERHQQGWDYESFCDIVKTAHPVGQACFKSGTRALHIGNICYGRTVEPSKPLVKVAGSLKDGD